ncbi:ROK family protein [Sphaerisporangium perillae]|uniref:ROK family protein n=1 Tax=Sphaerisporangium perillae TaxID=2935860 RepID=UPI00243505D7|nr:ROK family protein [Sphaerisporangium perillae]
MSTKTYVVALDVGGTSMKGGLVGSNGEVLLTDRRPTPRDEGPLRVIETIRAFIDDLAEAGRNLLSGKGTPSAFGSQASRSGSGMPSAFGSQDPRSGMPSGDGVPSGVGLAVPGLVTSDTAVYSANIGWRDVPAADFTSLDVPVRLGHDVRTGGLAERILGAGRAEPDFLFLPIGTGIAGAMIIYGEPYGGSSGWGGEIGHIPVFPGGERCACGQIGCLETYASAASVARRYTERLSRAASVGAPAAPARAPMGAPATYGGAASAASTGAPATSMGTPANSMGASAAPAAAPAGRTSGTSPTGLPGASSTITHVSAEDVVALAMRGDPHASAVWDEALEALSLALASYTLLLDPSSIVIGGGLAEAGEALFEPLAERLQSRLTFRAAPPLRHAALGVNAGMLGAALLGWQAAGIPDAGSTWAIDVLRSPSVP